MKLYLHLSEIPELQGLPNSTRCRVWQDYLHQNVSAVGLLGLLAVPLGAAIASGIGPLVGGAIFITGFVGAVVGGAFFRHVVILDIRKRIADRKIKV